MSREVKTFIGELPTLDECPQPVAPGICIRETGKVYVRCPFCRLIHSHGSEDGAKIGNIGWRMGHGSGCKMYYIQSVGIFPKKYKNKAFETLRFL